MKANKAPEKIYIPINNTIEPRFLEDYWVEFPVSGQEAEYTRTDAFIEKACEFLAENMTCDGYTLQTKAKFIRGFKNHMKGE